jgi:hypothetical protein
MSEIDTLIIENAPKLKTNYLTFKFDSVTLLRAIAQNESSYGINKTPRFEPAFYVGGRMYNHSKELQAAIAKYGKPASCSYSSFQIMYETARELGYNGDPVSLNDDSKTMEWVLDYINNRILKYMPTKLEDIFDAYNSGSFRDKFIPLTYVHDGMAHYEHFLANPIVITPTPTPVAVKYDWEKDITTIRAMLDQLEKGLKGNV